MNNSIFSLKKIVEQNLFFLLVLALCFTFSFSAQSQNVKKKWYPAWTYHQDSININGISVGLLSIDDSARNTNTNGIKLELIGVGLIIPLVPKSPIVENTFDFEKLETQAISERINGLSISGSGTSCHCLTNGVTAGLIGQINFKVNGISASLLMNFTQKQNGLMLGMLNDAYLMRGLQLGVGNNGYKTKGAQLGIISNFADEMRGLQIGIFNKSKNLKGVQIGIWNVNQKRKLPLINWNFK